MDTTKKPMENVQHAQSLVQLDAQQQQMLSNVKMVRPLSLGLNYV
jgi:hypothetical protein